MDLTMRFVKGLWTHFWSFGLQKSLNVKINELFEILEDNAEGNADAGQVTNLRHFRETLNFP